VDQLAKEATEEEDNTIVVPLQDFRISFKKKMWSRTQDTINRETQYKGKQYFEKFYDKKKETMVP